MKRTNILSRYEVLVCSALAVLIATLTILLLNLGLHAPVLG